MITPIEILLCLLCFLIFTILQALFINGVKASMDEGMILDGYYKWAKKNFNSFWIKPAGGCLKCMSSSFGSITYWPTVLFVFGYKLWMIPVFIADVFIVLVLSWLIYKKM